MQAVKQLDRFEPRGEGAFQAYLRQALINRIRTEIRRVQRRPLSDELDSQTADPGPSPLECAIGREGRCALRGRARAAASRRSGSNRRTGRNGPRQTRSSLMRWANLHRTPLAWRSNVHCSASPKKCAGTETVLRHEPARRRAHDSCGRRGDCGGLGRRRFIGARRVDACHHLRAAGRLADSRKCTVAIGTSSMPSSELDEPSEREPRTWGPLTDHGARRQRRVRRRLSGVGRAPGFVKSR